MIKLDNTIERWKDIPDYEGLYQVSSFGNVRSSDRLISQSKGSTIYSRHMIGKPIQSRLHNNGYLMVKLSKNGKTKLLSIHRMVLSTFNPPKDKTHVVNHIDGNKQNNHLSNLEWVTHRDNNIHAFTHNLIRKTSNRIVVCETTGITYPSIKAAAKSIGVTPAAIASAIRKNQKSKGLQWKLK